LTKFGIRASGELGTFGAILASFASVASLVIRVGYVVVNIKMSFCA
jgi:hypothetical protein